MQAGVDQGVIHKGFVVYMGDGKFSVTEKIRVVSGEHLLISG